MVRARALLACWLTLAWTAGNAQAKDAERVARDFLQKLGGDVQGPGQRAFLAEGQGRAWEFQVDKGCVGFLAFGRGQVRDVDLALHSTGGLALDEDETVAPYAYVRTCTERAATLYVAARMFSGQGELLLLRVNDAPTALGVLPDALSLAAAPGGRLEPPRDVGPSTRPVTAANRLEATASRLQQLGYRWANVARELRLYQGSAATSVPLEAGRCYLLVAAAAAGTTLLLEAVGPFESQWMARGLGGDATLAICGRNNAEYGIRVRSRPGRTAVRLSLFEHPLARIEPGAQVEDGAELARAEARHRLAALGMQTRALGDAWAEPGTNLIWPLKVDKPGCYAVVAVTPRQSRVDLRLTDDQGRLLARDDGRARAPTVYFCTEHKGPFRASIRSSTRPQRVTLVLGEGSS